MLRVLSYLDQHPEGVRAADVAALVGKSRSTAYYLLASLLDEGFVRHTKGLYFSTRYETASDATPAAGEESSHARVLRSALEHAATELYGLTGRRTYLGMRAYDRILITSVRGRQGLPRVRGLTEEITHGAHALALGKVCLAQAPAAAVDAYITRGLRRFTRNTIARSDDLLQELDRVRSTGVAVDREEYVEGSCCIASPIIVVEQFMGAIGISVTSRHFEATGDDLRRSVAEVSREAAAELERRLGTLDQPPQRRLTY